ncbi:MAG: DUF2974 domain-containing protein [Sphaerochaetaceae bacterium]|nr:DUF2974 domain-containing protein [Sphaerochaetaceae bacterium]
MNNLYEYLKWRGDLSFKQDPLNEVDAVIFAWLSYFKLEELDYSAFIGKDLSSIVSLYENVYDKLEKKDKSNGVIASSAASCLIATLVEYPRFKNVKVSEFKSLYDTKNSIQFAVVSYSIAEGVEVVAFRGTDTSVAGWKEDCMLSFMEALPAQEMALEFLNSRFSEADKFYVTGHSKGGNLAIYAVMKADSKGSGKIKAIYNFDGPGFCFDIKETPNYPALSKKVHSFLPQESIVGMLLEHVEDYKVVKSSSVGILQHLLIHWNIMGKKLVTLDKRARSSVMIDSIVSTWLGNVSFEERKEFVYAIFDVLEKAGIEYFNDLTTDSFTKLGAIMKEMAHMKPEQRKMVRLYLTELMKVSSDSIISSLSKPKLLK